MLDSFINNHYILNNNILYTNGKYKNEDGFLEAISISKFRKLKNTGINTILFGITSEDDILNLYTSLSIFNSINANLNIGLYITFPYSNKILKLVNKLIRLRNIKLINIIKENKVMTNSNDISIDKKIINNKKDIAIRYYFLEEFYNKLILLDKI